MSYLAWCGSFSPGRKIIRNIATKQPIVMTPATDATATMPHNGPISMCCMACLLRALGARGGHFGRRHRPGLIAPGAALVIDDVGDLRVAQLAGERRHHAGVVHATDGDAVRPLQYGVDVQAGV